MARPRLWEWLRHHASSVLATAVDYAAMVAAVELGHVGPVKATVLGAFCGAVTNFLVNRTFTYRAGDQRMSRQAGRYALVSGASLGLNALGEHLFTHVIGLQYLLARIITSTIVSNAWNYPMQRFFVFAERPAGRARP